MEWDNRNVENIATSLRAPALLSCLQFGTQKEEGRHPFSGFHHSELNPRAAVPTCLRYDPLVSILAYCFTGQLGSFWVFVSQCLGGNSLLVGENGNRKDNLASFCRFPSRQTHCPKRLALGWAPKPSDSFPYGVPEFPRMVLDEKDL